MKKSNKKRPLPRKRKLRRKKQRRKSPKKMLSTIGKMPILTRLLTR